MRRLLSELVYILYLGISGLFFIMVMISCNSRDYGFIFVGCFFCVTSWFEYFIVIIVFFSLFYRGVSWGLE